LGRVVEGVQDIRVVEAGGYLVTQLKHEEQNGHAPWFPLAQQSDGTLRVLGLLAALYQATPHSLIAIEEPELSIHPGALAMLSEVIEEAATRSQVLITTQSPDLISCFSADQLRVVERVGTETQIGPIDERQREAINTQLFSAGDLLRIEGLHTAPASETTVTNA
jgi:predicted ATPase